MQYKNMALNLFLDPFHHLNITPTSKERDFKDRVRF